MNTESKILLAGDNGFVGSNIKHLLLKRGYRNLIHVPPDLDFRKQADTELLIYNSNPSIIILAAGKVGGIIANKNAPHEFLYDNLMIWSNIIHAAAEIKVSKLIFLGSSTIYSSSAPLPFKEESFFQGSLDSNTESYALAKITAIKLCENYFKSFNLNFIPVTLSNLYGPGDHFNLDNSHVVPALIYKFHQAKFLNLDSVTLWGSGNPTRDILYVEDLANAIIFVLENIRAEMIFNQGISHINIGSGKEISIKELSLVIKEITGFKGKVFWDASKPDGPMRKYLDITRINKFGWEPKTLLYDGLQATYQYFISTRK